jgi:transcription elongation factor Elf1
MAKRKLFECLECNMEGVVESWTKEEDPPIEFCPFCGEKIEIEEYHIGYDSSELEEYD